MSISRWTGVAAIASLAMPLSSWRGGSGTAIVKLQSAGASFPAPLYSKWFKAHLPLPAA